MVAHLTGGQGVAGSNPVSPTTDEQLRAGVGPRTGTRSAVRTATATATRSAQQRHQWTASSSRFAASLACAGANVAVGVRGDRVGRVPKMLLHHHRHTWPGEAPEPCRWLFLRSRHDRPSRPPASRTTSAPSATSAPICAATGRRAGRPWSATPMAVLHESSRSAGSRGCTELDAHRVRRRHPHAVASAELRQEPLAGWPARGS